MTSERANPSNNILERVVISLIQVFIVIFLPLLLPLIILGWVWRRLVFKIWAWNTGHKCIPVDPADLMFIMDTPNNPHSSIIPIFILSGSPTKERVAHEFRRVYNERDADGIRHFWKLGVYPSKWLGYWGWSKVKDFKLENQITILNDYKLSTEDDIPQLLKTLFRRPFPLSSPWWDITVITNYVNGPESLVIFRLSHAICDGYSITKLCFRLSGFKSLPPSVPIDASVPTPLSIKQLFTEGLSGLLRLSHSLPEKNIFTTQGQLRSGESKITGRWNCALTPKFPLRKVRFARKVFSTSFYAIILSAVVSGMRAFAKEQGWNDSQLPEIIKTIIPLSKPKHKNDCLINHWRAAIIDLPFHNDTYSTIRDVEKLVKKWKISTVPELNSFIYHLLSLFPLGSCIDKITNFNGNTLLGSIFTSSIEKLPNIFGEEVEDFFHFMPVHRETLAAMSWGCVSSNGHFRISLTAEESFFPKNKIVQAISNCIYKELETIYQLAMKCREENMDVESHRTELSPLHTGIQIGVCESSDQGLTII